MDSQQGAQEILAHIEASSVPVHEYAPVQETDFAHLDLKFYRETRRALEGMGFIHLEDCENRTLQAAPGNVLKPVMIRVMVSADGTVSAGIYHARLRALWLSLLTMAMRQHPGRTIDFETEFTDGSFVCTTNATGASAMTLPPAIDNVYLPSGTTPAVLLQRHRDRVAAKIAATGLQPHRATTIADLRAAQQRMNALRSEHRKKIGGLTKEELENLTPGGRWLAHDVHREMQTLQQVRKDGGDANDELLAAVAAKGENLGGAGSSNRMLLLTAMLFIVLGGMSWGWRYVVFLTTAVALHELGHVLAMRIFGYKNVRMLFLPMFGGLATGEPRELDATKNALVALAGPVFGLLTVVVAILAAMLAGQPSWLVQFAWVSLILNALNLVPLVPLDGGRFTNETLFSRHPVLELVFRLVAIAGLGWFAYGADAWLLGGVAVFMLLTTHVTYRRACLIRDARRDPAWQIRPLDRDAVASLREIVAKQFQGVPEEKYRGKLPDYAHGMWLEIRKRFPGVGATLGLLAGYLVVCAVIVPALAIFMAQFFERPSF